MFWKLLNFLTDCSTDHHNLSFKTSTTLLTRKQFKCNIVIIKRIACEIWDRLSSIYIIIYNTVVSAVWRLKNSPRTCILCCHISPVQISGVVFTVDIIACTGHFVMVPLNLTYLHCFQHSLFEHLFNLYYCSAK